MAQLESLRSFLDDYFGLRALEKDPAFARHVPAQYDAIGYSWQKTFEPDFCQRFNGLMLRGASEVKHVYCTAFPSRDALDYFLDRAEAGDLLFTHHALDFRSGDPRGAWGSGFIPIDPSTLRTLQERELSIYSCHAPLDYHAEVSTSRAMMQMLGGEFLDSFWHYGGGHTGILCAIEPLSTGDLVRRFVERLDIPYVDQGGPVHEAITRVALVGGAGNSIEEMRRAEEFGAQAYITGEIRLHIDNERGHRSYAEMTEYLKTTGMSCIGISHSASEQIVMEEQIMPLLSQEFVLPVAPIREQVWWR